jgi:soluble lytic murein transglycosylase
VRSLLTRTFTALSATATASSLVLLPAVTRAEDVPMCLPVIAAHADAVCTNAPAAQAALDTSRVYDEQLLFSAQTHLAAGRVAEARAALREAATRFPLVHDHFALMEGEIALAANEPTEARALFESALESPNSFVKLRARIGRVRALLQAGDPEGSAAMRALMHEYPELPDGEQLRLAEARSAEVRGRLDEAATLYRQIDLEHPGSYAAVTARDRMMALRARNIAITPYTQDERVARASALVASGPMDEARREVDAILAILPETEGEARRAVLRLAMRVARVEGRFEDAETYDHMARAIRREPARGRRAQAAQAAAEQAETTPADGEPALTAEEAEALDVARIAYRRVTRGRSIRSVPAEDLAEATGLASELGMDDVVRAAVDRAFDASLPPEVRFAVAMAASGTPADDLVLRLLGSLRDQPEELGQGARYHHARTLERLGRLEDAASAFERMNSSNRNGSYYGVWARQRLVDVRTALARRQATEQVAGATDGGVLVAPSDGGVIVDHHELQRDAGVRQRAQRGAQLVTYDGNAPVQPVQTDYRAIADRLHTVAATHEHNYPWLARAEALLRMRAADRAQSELFEALVAWRRASGRPIGRTGIEAVSRGEQQVRRVPRPPRRPARGNHRARAAQRRPAPRPQLPRRSGGLDEADRTIIADVAAALGDYGTAIALGMQHEADDRPRAYANEVETSARRYGVDPNLIYAVMRVESVYQSQIVSYAGAIGLMQIMPRTGELIARQLGRTDFTTADLLDPRTNIDFAAWYLASLLERFDGRVPLAIASYNGGPHNVRLWIEAQGSRMPLDAFLERIPFEQTHRYVRRVLVHYAAYREQAGLEMVPLEVVLPGGRVDPVAF